MAFVGFVAAFGYELISYQEKAVEWAKGDINSRAHLAAAHLAEPLRTQDFAAIRRIGADCETDGVHLVVTSDRGGVVFSSQTVGENDLPMFSDRCPSGEYEVMIGMPGVRVLAPFKRAIRGFALAALVGIAGVLLFFFVTYRQRVRIRELAKLEKFRREFIADVSHEIKTPLSGILGAVDLLGVAKGEDEGERRNLLVSLIQKESKRLNGLVQSILDLARLEREGDVLNLAETDLTELAADLAAKRGVRFEAGVPSSHCIVRCDAQLIGQAVENLIVNAVRHSGTDDIAVTVACDERMARVVVEDHGIGVPLEHAARIFERFHRVDPARASETGGAGLGLAIVRRIARLHGGDVILEAVKPRGCRFTLAVLRNRR